MNNDDLTVTDVLADHSKNFCSIYQSVDEEDDTSCDTVNLHDNEYYTESEFLNITTDNNLDKEKHLMILSHPSLDNPQKKNQKTHLGDPKIDQVDGVGYPKTFETKSS